MNKIYNFEQFEIIFFISYYLIVFLLISMFANNLIKLEVTDPKTGKRCHIWLENIFIVLISMSWILSIPLIIIPGIERGNEK